MKKKWLAFLLLPLLLLLLAAAGGTVYRGKFIGDFIGFLDPLTGKTLGFSATNVFATMTNRYVADHLPSPGDCWKIKSTNGYEILWTNGPCGGGGSQTPWLSDIDAAQFALTNLSQVSIYGPSLDNTGRVALHVDAPWSSYDGNGSQPEFAKLFSFTSGETNVAYLAPWGGIGIGRSALSYFYPDQSDGLVIGHDRSLGEDQDNNFNLYSIDDGSSVTNFGEVSFRTRSNGTANVGVVGQNNATNAASFGVVVQTVGSPDAPDSVVAVQLYQQNGDFSRILTLLDPSADQNSMAYYIFGNALRFENQVAHHTVFQEHETNIWVLSETGDTTQLGALSISGKTNRYSDNGTQLLRDGVPVGSTANHFSGTTNPPPTIAAGAGAGSSPTITIVGGDTAGYISIISGTLPSVSAVIATVTFGTAYLDAPSVVLWPRNAAASVLTFLPYAVGGTTTWTFNSGAVALGGSTTYQYNYIVMGTGNH